MYSTHHECPTELSSLSSGSHDRERREERHIQKIDLPRAKRYDMKEETHNGREKYTMEGWCSSTRDFRALSVDINCKIS